MKQDEVPQDHNRLFAGERKALYAVDPQGKLVTVPSSGWQVEETVTSDAVAEYERLAREALLRVRAGQSSPLEYHMYAQRMDEPVLAQSVGIWRWRLRRHFKPAVFSRLKQSWLSRYADALGIPVEQLRQVPPA